MEYNNMKVAELREESRKRGLTLESKGHKFTKAELIERLTKYDLENKDTQVDIDKKTSECVEVTEETKRENKTNKVTKVYHAENVENKISFAKTLDEIIEKYGHEKQQRVYDENLMVGSLVVFMHYVEAKDGNIYKKLRTAKVVGVNRKQRKVRVKTLLGTELELLFSDLFYIRKDDERSSYPMDIKEFLRNKRTEKGRALINEKLNYNN
jgi:hypothetical protein|nr:MAG TPA: Splicing factor [Caudoviricetes sp.]